MSPLDEQLTEQFHEWERRGRGWQVFATPVAPEPPFRPFFAHCLPPRAPVDDGRRPTFLSSLVQRVSRTLSTEPEKPPIIPELEEEPEPESLACGPTVEIHTSLPAESNIHKEAFEHFFSDLSLCREPVGFELLGVAGRVSVQFVAGPCDAPLVRRQLQAHFPEATFQISESVLRGAWESCEGYETLVFEFGLGREFMLALATGKSDPYIGIVGALAELGANELGLFQVLFQAAHHPWAESITRSVTHADGSAFFINVPDLPGAAKEKTRSPLYAAVVRIAVRSEREERTLQIACDLASALRVFAAPNGNDLIPLSNEDYPIEEHIEDVVARQSRRSGMLLNSEELTGFVHLPSSAVRSRVFERETGKTKAAPAIARQASGVLLGDNVHIGQSIPVRLTPEQRVRHMHIIGASGTGKSTLLFNLIRQDIEAGEGLAVLDPHGDLVDRILGIIPENRIGDVVLVDPSDEEFSVGFNILSAHSDLEKNLLASDLVSVFQRLSTSWGDQMGSVLNNAILAFLESSRPATLADLRRFLIEPAFRAKFLETVRDPDLVYYWQKGFPQLSGTKSIGSVLTRLETFLAPKPIRYMVSQTENRLDFGAMMDTGKIFLAKLSQGLLGKENSYLLGTLLVSKFQQLAMARQAQQIAARRDFWLYLDEFHNFISPSMAEILSGARKYRVGLILAHQELRQLQRDSEVASAVMSNPYTRIVFRVGDDDARKLADGFGFFEARDLQNLETGTALARIERSDFDFNLSIPRPDEPDPAQVARRREDVITASREKCALPRAQVEALLHQAREPEQPPPKPVSKPAVKDTKPRPEEQPPTVAPATLPHPQVQPSAPVLPASEPQPPLPEPVATAPVIAPAPPPVLDVALPETKPAPVSEKPSPTQPADLGRGGAQHKAIQQRIKQAGEALGFRSVIEKQILSGQGSVDLLLERSDKTIACEISISTTIDHEVGNVAKCLKAGFPKVAVICLDEERLKKIAAAVAGSLGPEAAARVIYLQPDKFITGLQSQPSPVAEAPKQPEMRRGYKVKRAFTKRTPQEQKQLEEEAIRSIAETMRKEKR